MHGLHGGNNERTLVRSIKVASIHRRGKEDGAGDDADDNDGADDQPPAVDGGDGDDDDDDISMCPVCLLSPRNSVFNPCRHTTCNTCADRVFRCAFPANRCPACRGSVISIFKIYGMR